MQISSFSCWSLEVSEAFTAQCHENPMHTPAAQLDLDFSSIVVDFLDLNLLHPPIIQKGACIMTVSYQIYQSLRHKSNKLSAWGATPLRLRRIAAGARVLLLTKIQRWSLARGLHPGSISRLTISPAQASPARFNKNPNPQTIESSICISSIWMIWGFHISWWCRGQEPLRFHAWSTCCSGSKVLNPSWS